MDDDGRRPRAAAHDWTWDEAHELPSSQYHGDIHCVTTWSKLGTSFTGVSVDVRGGKAWAVWTHEGRPLPAEHGGPVRLLVPHLYVWKSAK